MTKVRFTKTAGLHDAGFVTDVPPLVAAKMVKQKRVELVPEPSRAEKMVPQRQPERMKRR
jgi:hypothetical protein